MDVKFYKCMHCGNIAVKVFDAGVPLVVAAGTCIYFYSQMKTAVEQRSAHAYVVNGSFDLTGSDDTFVTSYQTRTLVETDDDDKR